MRLLREESTGREKHDLDAGMALATLAEEEEEGEASALGGGGSFFLLALAGSRRVLYCTVGTV